MTDDPFDFLFDKKVRDVKNGITLSVTLVDPDPEIGIQLDLRSGSLQIPWFMTAYAAHMLGTYLLQACDAYDAAQPAVGKSYTDGEIDSEG